MKTVPYLKNLPVKVKLLLGHHRVGKPNELINCPPRIVDTHSSLLQVTFHLRKAV